jgi:hypothetical protein
VLPAAAEQKLFGFNSLELGFKALAETDMSFTKDKQHTLL